MKHTIRDSANQQVTLDYTIGTAIKLFCTECCGWETHPKDCGQNLCPLYPFRGRSMLSIHGYKPRELSDEQKEINAERLKKYRKSLDIQ